MKDCRLTDLGAVIREQREFLGMTQVDLAVASGYHANSIIRAEKTGRISVEAMLAICDALELTMVDMWELVEVCDG